MTTANAQALTMLESAQAMWQRGESVRAEAVLRDLLVRLPAWEEAAMLLAKLLQSEGRLDAASGVIFGACRNAGFDPDQSLRGALFIQQCQRQSIAFELCNASLARGAHAPAMHAVAGNLAFELGDFAAARTHYIAALAANIDLNAWPVLGALAGTMRYRDATHPDFARFVSHFRDTTFSPRARAITGFGLAKAYDNIGDFQAAAQVLHDANAIVRNSQPWSKAEWNGFVEQRTREQLARAQRAPDADFIPIFVVGLPRTGTTLTATQLAVHFTVRDRGELRVMRFIADRLIKGGHMNDVDALNDAAALYIAHVRQDDARARFYIDQDPLNFRYLHIVAALFPQARIIHCRRGRRDTALSLWSQDFAHKDCAFAYDFTDIVDYADGHDRLMQHWRSTTALQIHAAPYEDLVASPQKTLQALREFIGLDEADNKPHADAPAITSASLWQARQPIYSSSIGRWKSYAPFVPDLAEIADTG